MLKDILSENKDKPVAILVNNKEEARKVVYEALANEINWGSGDRSYFPYDNEDYEDLEEDDSILIIIENGRMFWDDTFEANNFDFVMVSFEDLGI